MRNYSASYLYALSQSDKQASWGNVAWEGSKFIPFVGAVPSFIDAGTALAKGRFGEALMHGAGGAAGLIMPGGGAIAKGLTGAGRMAMRGGASMAARGAVNAGVKGVAQTAAGTAAQTAGAGLRHAGNMGRQAINAGLRADKAVAAGIQKVIPVAQGATLRNAPVRAMVNSAVKNPTIAASIAAPMLLPSGGAAPAAAQAAPAAAGAAPGVPSPQFRPAPMANFAR